jgi:tetratricopeptide (TPR) repeat protein
MTATTLNALSKRATSHVEAGDWGAAREVWLEALSIAPDSGDVMLELSYVESLSGNYRMARDWAIRASGAVMSSKDSTLALLKRLRTFNEARLLHQHCDHLLADAATPTVVLLECARQLASLGGIDMALRCAETAVTVAPADLPARLMRGQMLASQGRIEAAAGDFEWVLARSPRVASALLGLARLRKQTPQSNHVGQLRALLKTPGLRPADAATLARALHKELDDLGDYEGAWQALQTLCRARRPTIRYDRTETRALVEALESWSPGELRPTSTPASSIPIFVVGMHRSGTTLLEQLLDASPQVHAAGELYDFTTEMRYATDHHGRLPMDLVTIERARGVDFSDVGRRYLDGIAWRLDGESHFTDKEPSNFFNIGFICQALPHARILHMVRDPIETCFSNLRELYSNINPHSYDQLELADFFLQYRRLMAHWHSMFPGRILDVDYARLTADPEGTMRDVAAFCGMISWKECRVPRPVAGQS